MDSREQYTNEKTQSVAAPYSYINWLEDRLNTANRKIRQYEAYILDLSKDMKELQKISQRL